MHDNILSELSYTGCLLSVHCFDLTVEGWTSRTTRFRVNDVVLIKELVSIFLVTYKEPDSSENPFTGSHRGTLCHNETW